MAPLCVKLSRPARFGAQFDSASGQIAARDPLHAEIALPAMLADLVNRHDMRMVQRGGGFGFAAEAL
jgi:hypothetical protein